MSRIYQVPDHARRWLTLSLVAASLPQLLRGPWWQTALLVTVLVWRALIDRQRLPVPGRWVRLSLLAVTVAATWYSFGLLHGPEAGTALVTSLFALKYLELIRKRDAHVLLVLGYFVCATVLLFHRGPGSALYVLGCLVLLTASLAGINYNDTRARRHQHLKLAAIMVGQALPLAVVLFVLVPRMAPLWDSDTGSGQARTGISDTLAPGQITDLIRSSDLAFRVQFEGAPPPHRDRYWRGLTYGYFDGTAWHRTGPRHLPAPDDVYQGTGTPPAWYRRLQQARTRQSGPVYHYEVIMAPSYQRWLYALAVPFTDLERMALTRDLRLLADERIDSPMSYWVTSVPGIRPAMPLGAAERRRMLQLPPGNPRTRDLARRWRAQYPVDADLVRAALRYFRRQPFYYTLSPPRLQGDTVDAFLFETRRGFCEHYASSFTVLMRAAGIPARVVGGYQGGEMNAGEYLQVRQYDAHAWSEVWLPGRGWVRVDPTAAVAPARIENGLRAALAAGRTGPGLNGLSSLARLPVLFQLRQWGDYLDFKWHQWVLGYHRDQQQQLLRQLLGPVTPWRVALALLGALSGCVAVLAALLLWRRNGDAAGPLQREFARLHAALVRRGMTPAPGVSPARLEQLVVRRWPAARKAAADWRRRFEGLTYRQDTEPDRSDLAALRCHRRILLRRLST